MADRCIVATVTVRTERKREFVANYRELPAWLQEVVRQFSFAERDEQEKAVAVVAEIFAEGLKQKILRAEVLGWDAELFKRELHEVMTGRMTPPTSSK